MPCGLVISIVGGGVSKTSNPHPLKTLPHGVQSAFDLRARSHAMVWRCVLTVFREPAKRRADVQCIRWTQDRNQNGHIARMAVLPRLDREPDMTATEVSLLRVSAERHNKVRWCGDILKVL